MMDCILNGIKLPICNSDSNILFVDSYKEEFFDIYTLNVGDQSLIAELVEVTDTGPLVRVHEIVIENKVYKDITFLIVAEAISPQAHINKSALGPGTEVTPEQQTFIVEAVETSPPILTEIVNVDLTPQVSINRLKDQAIIDVLQKKCMVAVNEIFNAHRDKIVQELADISAENLEGAIVLVDNNLRNEVNSYLNDRCEVIDDRIEDTSKLLSKGLTETDARLKAVAESYKASVLNEFNVFKDKLEGKIKESIAPVLERIAHEGINNQPFVNSLYEKFAVEHGSKIDKTLTEIFNGSSANLITEKFDFFKDRKVVQRFEKMIYDQWKIKESELVKKMKRIVLDFYYSWGSGGGSGNITINQGTSGGGGGDITTPYNVFQVSGLSGLSAVIDYFPLSAFKTAKYNIEVLSGDDVYSSEISVVGNAIVAKYTEYAVLHTTLNPFIEYAVNSTGVYLQLIAIADPDLLNMYFKGVRLDPLLQ